MKPKHYRREDGVHFHCRNLSILECNRCATGYKGATFKLVKDLTTFKTRTVRVYNSASS